MATPGSFLSRLIAMRYIQPQCLPGSFTRMSTVPLCVDLDGTLASTDLSWESLLSAAQRSPLQTLRVLVANWQNLAGLKFALSQLAELDISRVPVREELLVRLRQESQQRPLVLATGSNEKYARALAEHLGLFDEVIASTADFNCVGSGKARMLVERFGAGGFDYVGDSVRDLPVWAAARNAWLVSARSSLRERVAGVAGIQETIIPSAPGLQVWLRLFRMHQWSKNLLLLLPLLAGHVISIQAWGGAALGVVSFCCVASAGYVVNDLLDLQADRNHPRKRRRPLAAGNIPISHAVLVAVALVLAALLLAALVNFQFLAILLVYLVGTLAYSLYCKRRAPLDVFLLASLYVVRVLAGGLAAGVPVSAWLLTFAFFMFLSLALVKRHTELLSVSQGRPGKPLHGRGWRLSDLSLIRSLGMGAGVGSAVILAIYLQNPASARLYANPELLILSIITTQMWLAHVWLASLRGRMHDDPLVFAMRDRMSLVWIALTMVVAVLAK